MNGQDRHKRLGAPQYTPSGQRRPFFSTGVRHVNKARIEKMRYFGPWVDQNRSLHLKLCPIDSAEARGSKRVRRIYLMMLRSEEGSSLSYLGVSRG